MAHQGLLLVLSGPSGVGKGTVKSAMVKQKAFSFEYSVSMTTRKPRPGEVDGKDYYFVSEDRFQEAIKGNELLEYNEYVGKDSLVFNILISDLKKVKAPVTQFKSVEYNKVKYQVQTTEINGNFDNKISLICVLYKGNTNG